MSLFPAPTTPTFSKSAKLRAIHTGVLVILWLVALSELATAAVTGSMTMLEGGVSVLALALLARDVPPYITAKQSLFDIWVLNLFVSYALLLAGLFHPVFDIGLALVLAVNETWRVLLWLRNDGPTTWLSSLLHRRAELESRLHHSD